MRTGYSSKQRKGATQEAQGVQDYGLGSIEAKALISQIASEYKRPAPSVKEVRAMLDKKLGSRSLTEELYEMRQQE